MRAKYPFPLLLSGLAIFSMGFSLPKTNSEYPQFKPHMQAVYASLVQVMPLFLQGDNRAAEKDKAALQTHFKNLAVQSRAIRDLAEKSDAGHKALATQLASYTEAAEQQYLAGNVKQARFFLSDTVNTCFGCHTSRGTTTDSEFVANFNKDLKLENFDPLARARFLALSRQFDKSLKEYEALIQNSSTMSLDDFINVQPYVEYMVLGLRVKNSTDEVLATFQKLNTEKMPELVKKDVKSWIKSLEKVRKQKLAGTLKEAEKQIALAHKTMEYPQDRSGLVHMIVASRILHELVLDKKSSPAEKAQANYQLGLTEQLIGSEFFSDEPLAYFEETVKLAPKSDIARKAYAHYEDIVRFNFSGSGGTKIPEAEARKLKELRQTAF